MASKNIVCPVCGASCDDIQVELCSDKITTKNACKMGNAKFQEIVSPHRIREPLKREKQIFSLPDGKRPLRGRRRSWRLPNAP